VWPLKGNCARCAAKDYWYTKDHSFRRAASIYDYFCYNNVIPSGLNEEKLNDLSLEVNNPEPYTSTTINPTLITLYLIRTQNPVGITLL